MNEQGTEILKIPGAGHTGLLGTETGERKFLVEALILLQGGGLIPGTYVYKMKYQNGGTEGKKIIIQSFVAVLPCLKGILRFPSGLYPPWPSWLQ